MKATEEFLEYVNQFNNLNKKIVLKKNHTLRVVSLCEEIARELKLSQEEIELVKLCGLLHDIGRFEQINRYDSYDDLSTLDHGDVGEMILKKDKLINRFSKNNHNTILRAVKYHNKYRVPNTLNEKNKLFVNITRDADKIDILNLIVKGEISIKTNNTKMSNKIYKGFFNKKMLKNKDIKTPADEIASKLAFIFDLNFKESYKIVKNKNYVNKIIEIQMNETNNKDLINQLQEIKKVMNNYIEEMIQC